MNRLTPTFRAGFQAESTYPQQRTEVSTSGRDPSADVLEKDPLLTESPDDGRSPLAVAMQWVSQVMSIGFELVVPVGVGYWLDSKWGTQPWLLIVGALLGSFVAFVHLLQLAAMAKKEASSKASRHKP